MLKVVGGYQYPGTEYNIVGETLQPAVVLIVLNTAKEPFNHMLVRKALVYAIPFEQIRYTIYADQLERLHSVIPAEAPGHKDRVFECYTLNLARAKMQQNGST